MQHVHACCVLPGRVAPTASCYWVTLTFLLLLLLLCAGLCVTVLTAMASLLRLTS
jgi:hypothetical protein